MQEMFDCYQSNKKLINKYETDQLINSIVYYFHHSNDNNVYHVKEKIKLKETIRTSS